MSCHDAVRTVRLQGAYQAMPMTCGGSGYCSQSLPWLALLLVPRRATRRLYRGIIVNEARRNRSSSRKKGPPGAKYRERRKLNDRDNCEGRVTLSVLLSTRASRVPCEACPKPRDAYCRGWHIVRFVLRGGRAAPTLPRAQSWSVLWSLLRALPASVLHDYRDEGMSLLSCDDCLERRHQCVTAPHRRMSNPRAVNSFVFAVTVSLPKAKYLTAPHMQTRE